MKKLFLLLAVCLMAGTTNVFGQAEKEYDKENYLYMTDVKAEVGQKVVIPLSGAPDKPCGEDVRMLTQKLSLNDTRLKKS